MSIREALGRLPEPVYADVLESEAAYLFVFDLPGASAEAIDLEIEGRRLHLTARREKSLRPEFEYLREDRKRTLETTIPLPAGVDRPRATATIERGILELRLPKTERTDATTIDVT